MRGFGQATILFPSFHGLHLERLGPQQSFCVLNTKKKTRLQIMSLTAYASETKKPICAFKKEQKSLLHSERAKKRRLMTKKKRGGRPPKTLVVFLSLWFSLLCFHYIRTSKAGYFWPKNNRVRPAREPSSQLLSVVYFWQKSNIN